MVAWHAALLRPDRFRAVIALSLPYLQRSPVAPTLVMPRRKDAVFYLLYFQEPGVAEAELERDVRQTFLKMLGGGSVAGGSRERSVSGPVGMVPRDGGLLSGRPTPTTPRLVFIDETAAAFRPWRAFARGADLDGCREWI